VNGELGCKFLQKKGEKKKVITSIDEAMEIPAIREDIMLKFDSRCEILGVPPNPLVKIYSPCVYCSGHTDSDGYIIFSVKNKELDYKIRTKTHIAAFLLFKGSRIKKGKKEQVQHLCGIPYCANHDHLILGGPKRNGVYVSKTKYRSKHHQQSWKLSEPDKDKIRYLKWVCGYSNKLLSEMFGVSTQTVHRILNSKI
jgi:hypothetical protein